MSCRWWLVSPGTFFGIINCLNLGPHKSIMANNSFKFGMIGLGVMGRNLLLNMADHGFPVVGFDLDAQKTAALESSASPNTTVKGVNTLAEMIQLLEKPRKLMMLVPAGKPVDSVIHDLLPLLEKGDIVIDGGNSHYTDTLTSCYHHAGKRLPFYGRRHFRWRTRSPHRTQHHARRRSRSLSARPAPAGSSSSQGQRRSLCGELGKGAAGHYVKMVHNGIEYAIMQLISEAYDLLHRGLGLDNDELA